MSQSTHTKATPFAAPNRPIDLRIHDIGKLFNRTFYTSAYSEKGAPWNEGVVRCLEMVIRLPAFNDINLLWVNNVIRFHSNRFTVLNSFNDEFCLTFSRNWVTWKLRLLSSNWLSPLSHRLGSVPQRHYYFSALQTLEHITNLILFTH